ncbi:MAG TPA: GNAT family N-acetyltransferase [Azospirillum sp.]|nr:GNAT family N-acetyltransferase [Azospirillum sp.]
MSMYVREAKQDDVEILFHIRTSVKENHQSREEIAALGITPESVSRMLESDAKAWLCEIDGCPAGFSMAKSSERTVFALFVLPEYEGRGAGRALLRAAEDWLFGQGIAEIWLTTGADESLRAPGFYRHLDWHPVGREEDGSIRYIRRAPDPRPAA